MFPGASGIHLTLNRDGRPSGEAYIEVETEDDLEAALQNDRKNMGKRYVEGKKQCNCDRDIDLKLFSFLSSVPCQAVRVRLGV